jgi:hypothetical protein
VSLSLLVWVGAATAEETTVETTVVGLPLTGQEAVEFLTTAEVTSKPEDFDDLAITSPRRMELTKGDQTLRVIFKDENTLHRGIFRFGDGREVPMVKDTYMHEIAAYDLAVALDLDFVPPCVERKLFSRKGSVCLWVEEAITEAERKECGLEPPDSQLWNQQMYAVRLFQQLIADEDFSNIRNILVDANFKIYKVDSSLAFYTDSKLITKLQPPVYSREFLTALELLERDQLDELLKPSLLKAEIKSLWERRNRILERARKLIAEHGEDKILY